MATVVVPFRNRDPKRRLEPLGEAARDRLAAAMLADVIDSAQPVGRVIVVTSEPLEEAPPGVRVVPDPRRGQGAAVQAGLDGAVEHGLPAPFLVVNADLPCATARDLLALAGAVPEHGLALVAAADGTTNALALSEARLFEPVYGPGSAARFAALAPSRMFEAPNLRDDVDTVADLARVASRLGPHTRRLYRSLRLGRAA
ncbi:MAG TPA: 2-phospho-L-lactate guanylyltransferase [Gaiellaceae bacterium]|nr:2-phospho-L-lactate guanylyltransferase [Gaiellaceae bacterium]